MPATSPAPVGHWIEAARPKTLPAAIAPVGMGIAIAYAQGEGHALAALAALVGALLLQIGTNFANDYFDHVHGTDTAERLGPRRMTSAGLIPPQAMRRAFVLTFGLAILVGTFLVLRAGWPVVAMGLTGVLFGVLYTGGPKPLGYLGLGDVLVLLYFGPVAVAGTHYVQAGQLSTAALVAGVAPGLLATGLLAVNNLRDVRTDRATGKGTLAVRLGSSFARCEITACVLGAAAVPLVLWKGYGGPATVLLATAVCLTGLPVVHRVWTAAPEDRLLDCLAAMGRLLVLFAAAFIVGWLW